MLEDENGYLRNYHMLAKMNEKHDDVTLGRIKEKNNGHLRFLV